MYVAFRTNEYPTETPRAGPASTAWRKRAAHAEPPLVSVGIPSYNRPQGLDRLLSSITKQTVDNIEILISDDCSPNSVVKGILEEFAARDRRIRFFRQPRNIGLIANHQFVRDQARGKYFMWAHDDDEFPADYIEACLRHFDDASDVVMVGPGCDRYFDRKYLSSYETWSNIGQGTYRRLRDLMPDAFNYHWRFEQYLSGLYLREAAPPEFSKYSKSQFSLFFALSERGALQHAPELKLTKNTTQQNYADYESGSHYRWLPALKFFGRDMQECIPITGQMLRTIWRSDRLTLIEKLRLTGQCAALFIRYPIYIELRYRVPQSIRRQAGALVRRLKGSVPAASL
jgi:glycosyltransferase involved in cell wall biosynthesis